MGQVCLFGVGTSRALEPDPDPRQPRGRPGTQSQTLRWGGGQRGQGEAVTCAPQSPIGHKQGFADKKAEVL